MKAQPNPSLPLSRPFRIAVGTVLMFGLFVQVLLILGVYMADRTLVRGVAPMQELLHIQRQASQALQLVKRQDQIHAQCTDQTQDEVCEIPLLLQNVAASAQRLLDGDGGLAGLPRSHALEGDARTVALALRDRATQLLPMSGAQEAAAPTDQLLKLQRGLQEVSNQTHQLEQLVLAQLQQDFRTKHWLDLLAVAAADVLMAATVITLFWMWSRVRTAFTQVQTSEARLRAYADAVPDTAYVLDSNGKVLEIMGQPEARTDRPMTIPVGQHLQDHRPPPLVNRYMQTIHQALATREVQTLQTAMEDVRGEPHWFEARVAVIEHPQPEPSSGSSRSEDAADQVIWLSRDVTGRIQTELELRQLNEELEQRVADRTHALNEAADELRRFNYTVSHDLRAPLRAVEAYTALAVEEAGDSLNPSARDLLERARKSAHQLAKMVESLLNLSRISEIPLQSSWLDLSAMAHEMCQAFEIDRGNHRLQCHIEPGMTVWADEHLTRSLLQNLISNAVKYSAHREPAVIDIGSATQADGAVVVHVRDNGAGFDMAHASQLFQPFTRLHSARDFPGDGIGLATARRIVMRHGGRIWAQGQVDAGATIYFTLPGQPVREREFTGSRPAPLDYSSRPAPLWPDIET